jgi:carbamoyl-phosphate synthase large subunit
METCYDNEALKRYMIEATGASDLADAPVLIDRFLSEAVEVDVDVVADFAPSVGSEATMLDLDTATPRACVCGVMEHIEEAGIHSGDSTCTIPPYSLAPHIVEQIKSHARKLAERLAVRGLMNMQIAVKDDELYIIEVNPRASRTAPFVSKAKGVPWPRHAARVMMGASLDSLGVDELSDTGFFSVKQSVFPFGKFPGVDVILGPEMRSTGEVMGADASLSLAVAKAGMSAGLDLPRDGSVFFSVRESDKVHAAEIARNLQAMGFHILATRGTHETLERQGIEVDVLPKISEGKRPNILDHLADNSVQLILNTATRKGAETDEGRIRAMAVRQGVPMITTIPGARAAVQAIAALKEGAWGVSAMQDYFPESDTEVTREESSVSCKCP